LTGCPVRGHQRPLRGDVRSAKRRWDAQYLEVVLGVALVELLPHRLADARLRGHHYPRPGTADAGPPRPLPALDATLLVELRGRLAEVPDVSARVLRVPVLRPLPEATLQVEPVVDLGAAHTVDQLRLVRDGEDVTRRLAILDSTVDVGRSRLEWEPRVVD